MSIRRTLALVVLLAGICSAQGPAIHAGPVSLTQNVDPSTVLPDVRAACHSFDTTRDNHFLRVFDLDGDHGLVGRFCVSEVDYGVEEAINAGTMDMLVHCIPAGAPLLFANLIPQDQAAFVQPDATQSIFTVAVGGCCDAGTQDLVIELRTPDCLSGPCDSFYIGTNDAGQTAPSYLAAPDCGEGLLDEPTDYADIGLPLVHIVMTVEGFGCADLDGDGFCANIDCDDNEAGCVLDCADPDGDGLAECAGDMCPTIWDPDQGGPPVKLNGSLVMPDGDVGIDGEVSFAIAADGQTVVYHADQQTEGVFELYTVPIDGGSPQKLNTTLGSGRSVTSDFALGGSRAVYRADETNDDDFEVFSAPLDGSGTPDPLHLTPTAGGSALDFLLTPDASRVVLRGDLEVVGRIELYTAPIDGSILATRLHALPPNDRAVLNGYRVSPDSSTVVFLADHDQNDVVEVYSVPADGSGGTTKLSTTPVSGGNATEILISPDGARVVYLADQDADDRFELYSVPIDGSFAAIKLNDTPPATGDVLTPRVSPDGLTVVYRADMLVDDRFDLYSVPIDGSSGPTRLNVDPTLGGDVHAEFLISPDSSRVIYLADQDTNDTDELYTVPIDGSAVPDKLHADSPADRDVAGDFAFNTAKSTVIYRADHETDEGFEVYSVPLDGSGAPSKLTPTPMSGSATGFRISADGETVVYRADQDLAGTLELYGVSTDGGAAYKLNHSFDAGKAVRSGRFGFSPDDSRVVYNADQDTDDKFELYSVARHADADGDGIGGVCDCDNGDEFNFQPPGETLNLTLLDRSTLTWDPPAAPGGTPLLYDTISSENPLDFVSLATCVETDDGSDTSATDGAPDPAPGVVRFYLVRAQNGCEPGEGTLGNASSGLPRSGLSCE